MSQVTRLKGAADSNPSVIKRWLQSKLMTHLNNEVRQVKQRQRLEARRQKENRRHVVEYFHQVDDGYSHLAIQLLGKLVQAYDIDLVVHLVRGLHDNNIPEPKLLHDLSRSDSAEIAPYYGLSFPIVESVPDKNLTRLALSILASLDSNAFITDGVDVSECLWRGDEAALKMLADKLGTVSDDLANQKVERGNQRRSKLKHYSGAMFYYEGEWYWGVDRLCHLERRLRSLSAERNGNTGLIAPKPLIEKNFPTDASDMTLEFYVSLRSPYTAIAWNPTLALAKSSGVTLIVRPLLPMVMRGVPATFQKAFYVWKDAHREAKDLGSEFGHFFDPIGKPIEEGYSLYMWALKKGFGNELIGAFLKAAFAEGINTNSKAGMRHVVEQAGLDWKEAQHQLNDRSWYELVELNRKSMYSSGIWGVPSYRLLDRSGNTLLNAWGQDRLWLVSRKIVEHA